jgi:hypothetical protein
MVIPTFNTYKHAESNITPAPIFNTQTVDNNKPNPNNRKPDR